MGTVYCGPFADDVGYEDHAGFAARILPDGTETGTWTYETREFTGYRAHCTCGWRGTAVYAPIQWGQELAEEEWDRDHLQPLIKAAGQKRTFTGDVLLEFIREQRQQLAVSPTDQNVLTERSRGALDVIERLERLLNTEEK